MALNRTRWVLLGLAAVLSSVCAAGALVAASVVGFTITVIGVYITIWLAIFRPIKLCLQLFTEDDADDDDADILVSNLQDQLTDLRTTYPDDVPDWIGSDGADRPRLDSAATEDCERLDDALRELASVNDELRERTTPTLQRHPEILANSLPEKAVQSGRPPRVNYGWQGCKATSTAPAYEWLIGCGYALVTAETQADMVTNLRAQTRYPEVEFSLEDWERFDLVAGWADELWAARDSESVTVWDVVEENEELLREQQALVDEVYGILADLSEALGADLALPAEDADGGSPPEHATHRPSTAMTTSATARTAHSRRAWTSMSSSETCSLASC